MALPPELPKIAILTVSDRASAGQYEDLGGPAVEQWLRQATGTPCDFVRRIVPDGIESVGSAIVELCEGGADLILTTGGTGPAPRDFTVEATRKVLHKELPGFGEVMRQASLRYVPTAILSAQTAGIRNRTLIVNLPGKPASIDTCLTAVVPAIPYCLELIGAKKIELSEPAAKS